MKSTYLSAAVLNAILNAGSLSIAKPWVSLHSADPGVSGADELDGAGYARVDGSGAFPAATSGTVANDVEITYATATGDWLQATHFGLWDAATGGNFLRGGELEEPQTVEDGGTASFDVGEMVLTEA
jgi:hypothetical protein